jgi:putative transposase
MSNQKLLEKNLELEMKPSDPGQMKDVLNTSKVDQDTNYTMLIPILKQKQKGISTQKKSLSTVESSQKMKKKNLKDKSTTSNKSTQNTKSSKKSVVASTSKEKYSLDSWIGSLKTKSKRLWLPTKTGFVGSDGATLNGYSKSLESVSWSTVKKMTLQQTQNSPRISCQSHMFSLQGTTVKGGDLLKTEMKRQMEISQKKKTFLQMKKNEDYEEKENLNYIPSSKKIQLLPTNKQRRILNDYFASCRKVWNVCLHEIKTTGNMKEFNLRDKFITAKKMEGKLKWTLRTPKRIREYALKDLLASYKGGLTRVKKKQIRTFKINSKKKEDKQSISLPKHSSWLKEGILKVCGMQIKLKEKTSLVLNHNMRCTKDGNLFFVYIPDFRSFEYKNQEEKQGLISIDLGVNTFGTYYSPDYEWGEIGTDVKEKLKSFYKKERNMKKNKKSKKALDKLKNRKINLIDDFHWKTVHWILSNYKEVLISRLYVPKTGTLTKRQMNDIRHCLFVDRLEYKSMFYKDRVIHEGKEHYTSSCCTKCGSRNVVKGSTLKCKDCGFEIHRDLGGARNFLCKYL